MINIAPAYFNTGAPSSEMVVPCRNM